MNTSYIIGSYEHKTKKVHLRIHDVDWSGDLNVCS